MMIGALARARAAAFPSREVAVNRAHLFLIGFVILFFELACIRWFSAYVVFLQFFTNVVLIAAFLGMSLGCVCANARTDWLARLPWLIAVSMGLAAALAVAYRADLGFTIDLAGQSRAPQVVFFGAEYRDKDIASFAVPMELVAALFFVLITLMFIGPGQVMGRCFDRDRDRVMAYLMNVAGSLAGILAFALASYTEAPPAVWFAVALTGLGYFLRADGKLTPARLRMLAAAAAMAVLTSFSLAQDYDYHWSPYYWMQHNRASGEISVNNSGFQQMVPVATVGSVYSLPYLLNRDAGGEAFEDVLVIGAGSGNDVAAALRQGARHVDAVEIDPAIARLGKRFHPDRPYDDARVALYLNDGRNFLRETDKRYDLVVYALVDSLILHSSVSNVRLESFLFTLQALKDVKRAMKPGGMFVVYNLMRQGWLVHRIAGMVEEVFGSAPIVITLPSIPEVRDTEAFKGFTVILAGNTAHVGQAFHDHGTFWLNPAAARHDGVNAFAASPPAPVSDEWHAIAPARLVRAEAPLAPATDDWPFLYLRAPAVPAFYLRAALLMAGLGLAIYLWQARGGGLALNGRMFFLGAGFLLLETKAVVHMALVFGSTWVVNSFVFASVLAMILAANVYVLKARRVRVAWHYGLLLAAIAVNALVPLDAFLAGGVVWRVVVPCVMVMSPIFFAGVVFAVSFRDSRAPHRDFGANIAGAVVGGFSEYLSMLLGFQHLLLVAAAFYALSALLGRPLGSSRPARG